MVLGSSNILLDWLNWVLGNAAAAAKLFQSCPTLCDPIHGSLPGSSIPEILQARTLKWVAISFSNAWKWKVKVKSPSHVRLFETPWTAAYQVPPSMGFSREEYWSGLPLPSPPGKCMYVCMYACKYVSVCLPALEIVLLVGPLVYAMIIPLLLSLLNMFKSGIFKNWLIKWEFAVLLKNSNPGSVTT